MIMLLMILGWDKRATALVPASYRVELKAYFDRGELTLSKSKQHRLEEVAGHLDDFSSAVIYIVAHGDAEPSAASTDREQLMAHARAQSVGAIFARRADPSVQQMRIETEPIHDVTEVGLVEIVISGFCRQGYAACDEHWRSHE
ncbi:OmpA family protein [Paraburkholderia sp. BL21I4N1]|uniref:OmpA family protein n=1 Tax=Paraburkholderia sp. BL21I4N1 TaxID=1938801 RepID=UPI0011B21437|nr:OmpA family protein [Paraburkholderia sp. BL21I4N1]